MERRRVRLLSTVLAAVLVIALVPSPATGGVIAGSGAASASVAATVLARSVALDVFAEPQSYSVFNVYRSTSDGVLGDKLTEDAASGVTYRDTSVEAGETYYYTVELVDADGKATQLAPVKAGPIPVISHPVPGVSGEPVEMPMSSDGVRRPGTVDDVHATDIPLGYTLVSAADGSSEVTKSATWSKGKYFVVDPVNVSTGATLTIPAGTTVMFSSRMTDATAESMYGINVHGALLAKGTSASRIRFTSSSSMNAMAQPSDWDGLYFDSTNPSEVSYCDIEYATFGVDAYQTNRPYVSYCRITDIDQVGVRFRDLANSAASPRPRIIGNTINRAQYGIEIAGFDGDLVDPLISQNNINGVYPISLFSQEDSSTGSIKGTIERNTVVGAMDAVRVNLSLDTTKPIAVNTAFTSNNMRSTYGYGINISAYNASPATITVDPVLSSTSVTSNYSALNIEAVNSTTPAVPMTAGIYARPVITGGIYSTRSGGAVDVRCTGDGIANAYVGGRFSSVTMNSNYEEAGLDFVADAPSGFAQSSPAFSGCTIRMDYGGWPFNVYSNGLKATSAPSLSSCKVFAPYMYGLDVSAYSIDGPAKSAPSLNLTTVECRYTAVSSLARAGNSGSALATATVLGSSLSGGGGLYTEAQATDVGSAASGATVADSVVSGLVPVDVTDRADGSSNGWGVYSTARSGTGTATADPQVSRSTVNASEIAVGADAYDGMGIGSLQAAGVAAASSVKSAPVVTNTAVSSTDGGIITMASGGVAAKTEAAPKVSGCTVKAPMVGCYSNAVATGGSASARPEVTSSSFSGGVGVSMLADCDGDEPAECAGSITRTTIQSTNNPNRVPPGDVGGLYVNSFGRTGASATPVVSDTAITSTCNGPAASINAVADTSGVATASPVITRGSLKGNGGGLFVAATGELDASAYCAPSTSGTSIDGGSDSGVYAEALTSGPGNATNKASLINTPVRSFTGTQIKATCTWVPVELLVANPVAKNEATVRGTSSTARISNVSTYGDGVFLRTENEHGDCFENSTVENLAIDSGSNGVNVYSDVNNGWSTMTTVSPFIKNNVIGGNLAHQGNGIYVYATGEYAAWSPEVIGNSVDDYVYDGIYLDCGTSYADGESVASGNTVTDCGGAGIYLGAPSPMIFGGIRAAVSGEVTASVTKNHIARTGNYSLWIQGHPRGTVRQNRMFDPSYSEMYVTGVGIQQRDGIACLRWDDSNYMLSSVIGNKFAGSRGTAILYDGGEAVTNYNSFGDSATNVNRPYNYEILQEMPPLGMSSPVLSDARYNWWSATSSATIESAMSLPVGWVASQTIDYSGFFKSVQPKVTSLKATKASGKVTFTLVFDRPMDETIKTLKFGKSSPYSSYSVTGAWTKSADGYYRTFKGTRTLTGLPTGVNLYFSGAKDLPGTLMYSTSKGIKL